MSTIRGAGRVAAALCVLAAGPLAAQLDGLPARPRSAHLLLVSEAAWHGVRLADGVSLRGGATLPLWMRPAFAGESDGVQLELDAWQSLEAVRGGDLGEHLSLGARYIRHPGGARLPASFYSAHYRAYLHTDDTNVRGDLSHEVGVSAGHELRVPAAGVQGFVLHGEALRGFGAVQGTHLGAGVAAALPAPGKPWVDGFFGVKVSANGYDLGGVARDFGYAATDWRIGARFPTLLRGVLPFGMSAVPQAGVFGAHSAAEVDRAGVGLFAGAVVGF